MADKSNAGGPASSWTFLSNHAHVLIVIAGEPEIRMRDVALRIGITERAVQRIVAELEEGGYLTITREGRRNRYDVHSDLPMRHAIEGHRMVSHLIDFGLNGKPKRK